jgi:hypothetical protein
MFFSRKSSWVNHTGSRKCKLQKQPQEIPDLQPKVNEAPVPLCQQSFSSYCENNQAQVELMNLQVRHQINRSAMSDVLDWHKRFPGALLLPIVKYCSSSRLPIVKIANHR